MTTALTRADASLLVKNVTARTDRGFAYVRNEETISLLGDDDFVRMMRDPVRNLGPLPYTVYPWNVIDYLSGYRTSREIQQIGNQKETP